MSLYHETADILSIPASTGGSLKARVFGKKDHKNPPQRIYALAAETCKWSSILKEVIDNASILRLERKLTPLLALLLVHDLLLQKGGVALPASHGLRASVERHKARLTAELTRARLRRKSASIDALRQQVESAHAEASSKYPRWIRVNTLLSSMEEQLDSTFKDFARVDTVGNVTAASKYSLYIDEHIPNLVAISPKFEVTKTDAYKGGAIILQDKASCFPAYLLDPQVQDGDVIDSCAAPGNKTTHLASIVHSRNPDAGRTRPSIYAFERNANRAKTLENMVKLAGGQDIIHITPRQDFSKVDPDATTYRNVGCLLLDPSCSGSGIVSREALPTIHLPEAHESALQKPGENQSKKRKRTVDEVSETEAQVLVDDDGEQTVVSSEQELQARLDTLSFFQLTLLQHAFKFPSARRITYSTCSIHAQENEGVVIKALNSDTARERGWRILTRERQVQGMREWPVRGTVQAAEGDQVIADACIRSYKDDGRGVMGFFVAAFIRDEEQVPLDNGTRPGPPNVTSKSRRMGRNSDISARKSEVESRSAASENGQKCDTAGGSDDEWGGFDD